MDLDTSSSTELPPGTDLEDAVAEKRQHSVCFNLNEKQIYKAQYLNHAFANYKGSTDQLKRVANIQRYAVRSNSTQLGILKCDPTLGENQIEMNSPMYCIISQM